MGLFTSLQHAWNVFTSRKPTERAYVNSTFYRPDRIGLTYNVDRTIVSSLYNRIAIDCSTVSIKHARLDQNGQFSEVINSKLNERLTRFANKDQTGRDFIRDVVFSLCDEGCVAIIPTHTDTDPDLTKSFSIESMRVCKIVEWKPHFIVVHAYDEETMEYKDVMVPKEMAAIIENPFYEIMNCQNSSLQRLITKLNILDKLDSDNVSGKLDIIIQLPYSIRNELKREQAKERLKDIEMQLVGSKHGIAYIDSTEHITQLNRPVENTLVEQIKDLTATVYTQLGLSEAIMNGTAGEQEMINYFNSTIEPFLTAIAQAIEWKFISPTARTQGQAIYFYRDPFRLIPADKLAELADKMTRNEIMSPNEFRSIIGLRPSKDPEADKLRNRNINQSNKEGEGNQNGGKDKAELSELLKDLRSNKSKEKEGLDVQDRRQES